MNTDRKMRVLTSTLNTIFSEAQEPIIKAMAHSALEETKEVENNNKIFNSQCKKHNWFGLPDELCPQCKKVEPRVEEQESELWNDFEKELRRLKGCKKEDEERGLKSPVYWQGKIESLRWCMELYKKSQSNQVDKEVSAEEIEIKNQIHIIKNLAKEKRSHWKFPNESWIEANTCIELCEHLLEFIKGLETPNKIKMFKSETYSNKVQVGKWSDEDVVSIITKMREEDDIYELVDNNLIGTYLQSLQKQSPEVQVSRWSDEDMEKLWGIANKEAEKEDAFPYSDFQDKDKNGVEGEHTGQALRGAYSQGWVDGYKAAQQFKDKQ